MRKLFLLLSVSLFSIGMQAQTREEIRKNIGGALAVIYSEKFDYMTTRATYNEDGMWNTVMKPNINDDSIIRMQTSAIMRQFSDAQMIRSWSETEEGNVIAFYFVEKYKIIIAFFINKQTKDNYTLSIGAVNGED